MKKILARVPMFLGFLFMVVLATASPLLALVALIGTSALYALAELNAGAEPETRPVRAHNGPRHK